MGLLSRFKMGLALTKDSLRVIRHNPRLLWFPVISGVVGLAFLGVFLGVTFGLVQVDPEGGALVGLFLVYLVLTFVSSFFSAALVHQTRGVFDGRSVSLKAGMSAAWDRKAPIFVWSVIAATVGILINMLESSDSLPAQLVGLLFSVAWTVLTFFIIPVLVFERVGVTEMFKRSGGLFKQTWGETPISLVAVSVIAFLVAVPFVAVGVLAASTGTTVTVVTGIGVALAGMLFAFLLSQTLQGVVKTSLYVYAREGKRPEEFDNVDFAGLPADQDSGRSTRGTARRGGFQ
jgi:hypothetical protein